MSIAEPESETEDALLVLRARADALESQLHEAETRSRHQLYQAELKAEAIRAGIVDVDGLRLLEPDSWTPKPDQVPKIGEVIGNLRRDKPWLFGAGHSSSAVLPPPAAPVRKRLATEMNLDEWRAARAELLRRR